MYVDLYLLSCYSTIEKVTVTCNQTGKLFKVRVSSLSRSDDGQMDRFGGGIPTVNEDEQERISSYCAERFCITEGSSKGSAKLMVSAVLIDV